MSETDPWLADLRDGKPPWLDRDAPADRPAWRQVEPAERIDDRSLGLSNDNAWSAGLLAYALLAALAVLAALGLWHLLRTRLATAPEPTLPRTAGGAAAVLAHLPVPAGATDPAAALQRCLEAGDWPGAVVWLYARALLRLDAARVLHLAPGATDRSHLRTVRRWAAGDPARAPVAEALGRLLPAFQAVRFGGGAADRALVDGLLTADADAARLLEPAP